MHLGRQAKPGSLFGGKCAYDKYLNDVVSAQSGSFKNLLPMALNMTQNGNCAEHTLLYEDPNIHYTDTQIPFTHICFPNLSDRALSGDSNKQIQRLIDETHEYLSKIAMRHDRLMNE